MIAVMPLQTNDVRQKTPQIQPVIARFEPISLAETMSVALLDRMETKYLMRVSELCAALAALTDCYRALEIDQVRLNQYQTLYFDTSDFALYRQHHNGFGSRYKVRARKYVESNLAFFEIKHKTNRDRTVKSRLSIPDILPEIRFQLDEFIDEHTPFHADALEPKLWNDYTRVTLVSKHRQERLTLDINVSFHWQGVSCSLPGIAVAEVKQDHRSQQSDFIQQMKQLGVRPAGFSKYTAGVYSLYSGIKINNFKPQIQRVQKLMQREWTHDFIQ
jgi:hypothetical protein